MPRPIGDKRSTPDRVIDTWIYKVKDVEVPVSDDDEEGEDKAPKRKRVVNKVVTVEVRIVKTTRQSEEAPHPLDTVNFEVVCRELDARFKGTDIELLRAAMWGLLDKRFEINWDHFYLVQILPSRIYSGEGSGFEFSYKHVYKGTTWDGKLLLKQNDWQRDVKITPWPGAFTDNAGKVIACIPVTEQNTAALEEFAKRIDKMREALADFLRPERIQQTLADMAGLSRLLPPIPEDVAHEERAVEETRDDMQGLNDAWTCS